MRIKNEERMDKRDLSFLLQFGWKDRKMEG